MFRNLVLGVRGPWVYSRTLEDSWRILKSNDIENKSLSRYVCKRIVLRRIFNINMCIANATVNSAPCLSSLHSSVRQQRRRFNTLFVVFASFYFVCRQRWAAAWLINCVHWFIEDQITASRRRHTTTYFQNISCRSRPSMCVRRWSCVGT